MAEENQAQQEPQQDPQQVTTKEPQRVTMKDPKKVEAGKRLAAHNHKKRELKAQKSEVQSKLNQYYRTGAVIAVGETGGLGYYIYGTRKGGPQSLGARFTSGDVPNNPPKQPPHPQTNKSEMD